MRKIYLHKTVSFPDDLHKNVGISDALLNLVFVSIAC